MSVREVSALLYLPDTTPPPAARTCHPGTLGRLAWLIRALLEQHEQGTAGNSGLADRRPRRPGRGCGRFAWQRRLPRARRCARSFSSRSTASRSPASFPVSSSRSGSAAGRQAAVLRSYSLAAPADERRFRIAVKREAGGVGRSAPRPRGRGGRARGRRAPREFTLDVDDDGPVVLLSAGVGVTPVLAMLGALARVASTRAVTWVHGARSGAEHPFADEVRELLSRLPAARSHVRYSRPRRDDRPGVDYDEVGRIDLDGLPRLGVPRDATSISAAPRASFAS